MRRISILVLCVALVVVACDSATTDSSTGVSSATTVASTPPSSRTTSTSTSTTTATSTFGGISVDYEGLEELQSKVSTVATLLVLPEATVGRDYIVTRPEGVFRVVDGTGRLVLRRPDVVWAEDDRMGGLVFSVVDSDDARLGSVEWLAAGSDSPEVILEGVLPYVGYVTSLDEHSAVVAIRPRDDGRVDTVMFDLITGTEIVLHRSEAAGEIGMYPNSIGGRWGVSSVWGSEPPGSHLVFTDLAREEGVSIPRFSNPWPEACVACGLWPILSPDGERLALVEFRPTPDDLGVADWDSYAGLDKAAQWDRWFAARRTTPLHVRVLSSSGIQERSFALPLDPELSTVDFEGREVVAGPGILDFDGRYLLLGSKVEHSDGFGVAGAELVDTDTGVTTRFNLQLADSSNVIRDIRLMSAPASTPTVLPPEAAKRPDFVWYGGFGLVRVEQDVPTVVWDQGPIQWADDDLSGGVLFMVEGQPTLLWQRQGDSEPIAMERESGYWYPGFTGSVDGIPTLFYSGMPAQVDSDTWPCSDWALNGYALATGGESTFVCLPTEDAGFDIYSFGGGRFVGTPYVQCGGDFTYNAIEFWDRSGVTAEVAANPFPSDRGCAPCELAALISDDGNLLAYRYRPDAFWPDSVNYPPGHLRTGDYDGWWDKSSLVPAVVAVVDLTTGEEMWSTEVGADVQLGDFDGRSVVLYRRDRSNHPHLWVDIQIVDTWGEHPNIHIDTPSLVRLIDPASL